MPPDGGNRSWCPGHPIVICNGGKDRGPIPVLADLPRVKLRGFSQDGSIEGKRGLWVTFKVGSKEMEWPVLVAPNREEVLIGLDFLVALDATIKARGGLGVDGEFIPT